MTAKNIVTSALFMDTVALLYRLIQAVLLRSDGSDLPNVKALCSSIIANAMTDDANPLESASVFGGIRLLGDGFLFCF